MNIKLINIITNIFIHNNSLYKNNFKCILKNNIMLPTLYYFNDKSSIEHIYPKSLLLKKDYDNFHNLYRASAKINNIRSNYKFSDDKNINWIKLNNNNYINHRYKLFNPNDNDKGIISRSLLYMSYQHNYKLFINKNIIYNWCINNKPHINEILHNIYGINIIGHDNPFITYYYHKNYKYFLQNFLNKY